MLQFAVSVLFQLLLVGSRLDGIPEFLFAVFDNAVLEFLKTDIAFLAAGVELTVVEIETHFAGLVTFEQDQLHGGQFGLSPNLLPSRTQTS